MGVRELTVDGILTVPLDQVAGSDPDTVPGGLVMSFVLRALDGSPLVGCLALVALVGPALLRQLLLFIGFKRALRNARNDEAQVSLFTVFSAGLAPHRFPHGSGQTDLNPSGQSTAEGQGPARPTS